MSNARNLADLLSPEPSSDPNFDGGTLVVDASENRVGVGTHIPASTFDVRGIVQVGVDGTGHNVKFFGDTATNGYMLWNQSTDDLILGSASKVGIGTTVPVTDLTIDGTITLKEQADADADTAAYGQIWVNTATPCELYFTTDAGNDVQITSGSGLAGAYNTDAAQVFNESGTAVDFRIEGVNEQNLFFVDGSADKVGIGTSAPASLLDVRGTVQVGVNGTGHDVKYWGDTSNKYWEWSATNSAVTVIGTQQYNGHVTVGSDGTGYNMKLFGDTAGSFMLWNQATDALHLTDSTPIKFGDGQDTTMYHDGSNFSIENSFGSAYLLTSTGSLNLATGTSGIAVNIGHTTSETTVQDNLTVTGDSTFNGGAVFNETSSSAYDFRIESDSNTHMFFVDAGENKIGINSATPGVALDVVGAIRATGDVTAYYSSDIGLKENIETIPNALTKIDSISGVSFDWKDEYINSNGGPHDYFMQKRDVGIIAQELKEVLPEAVRERENGNLAVKYDGIIPLLIQAVKELKQEVEILKN